MITADHRQVGVMPLAEAIRLALQQGVDLVEIVPDALPPVCKIISYPKYLYDLAKKRKVPHPRKLKELQLTPLIALHDYNVRLRKAIEVLCGDGKVKVALRLHRRQKAHPELGFQVVEKFLKDLAAHGRADAPAKLLGNTINLMLRPLPREKRAPNPYRSASEPTTPPDEPGTAEPEERG